MSEPLPYGLGTWVPALRGGAAPVDVLDAEDGAEAVQRRFDMLAAGERIALVADGTPGLRAPLEALESALGGPHRVERFVVFPGTGGGFVLLPSGDAATLRGGLPLLPLGQRRFSAARLGLEALAPFGVARRLGMPELSLVTRGERASFGDALARDDEHVAIASGVPGARQKLVARVLRADGRARTFVKLAHRPRSIEAVLQERRGLERIAVVAPGLAPELLDRGECNGLPWFTAEVVEGQRAPDVLHEGLIELLGRIQGATLARIALREHPLVASSLARLGGLDPAHDPDWHAEVLGLADVLAHDDEPLATSFAHGDFTSWNIAVAPGATKVFDWEGYLEDAPLLYDVFHFHLLVGVLVHRRDGASLLASLGPLLSRTARPLVTAANATAPDLLRALGLYLLHVTVRDEELQRCEPSRFLQLGLLRRARRELVRRVLGCLRDKRTPWALEPLQGERVA